MTAATGRATLPKTRQTGGSGPARDSLPLEKQLAMRHSMYHQLCFSMARAQRALAEQEGRAEVGRGGGWFD
jgi:hypothetical protein